MPTGRVAVAVTEDMHLFEIAIPCEIFGRPRHNLADPWYELRICAEHPGQTKVGAGFVAGTSHDLNGLDEADTVIVPARANVLDGAPPALLAAVRKAHARGARIASICTGAFVLAEAGLLDGHRATVHWMYASLLAQRFPKVVVDPAVLYVDNGQVLTSAGAAAGLDLCLHLVRSDLGAEIANRLARQLVIAPHRPGGQAQYVRTPLPAKEDDSLAPLLHWTVEHLHRPITIADMAKRQRLTPRTLIRRFCAATGTPPLKWLLTQRVQKACSLLESTDETPARIAELCGLGSEANLRHHFARIVGVPPSGYRRAFRSQHAAPATNGG
ncbi:GlxA family transcriptional regulator [Pendulispora albinea]|uniref:DJ-1/PfpI family protein n=1 Tax=Pendulispora albinea TaxID=2741071 RepID=A0ABZ2LMH3_9BACT